MAVAQTLSSRSLFALLVLNINNFILLTLIEDDTQPIDNYDLNSKDECSKFMIRVLVLFIQSV